MQMNLPFSPRPLHTDGMNLTLVTGISENALKHDSSFPSDHAVMFLTIASSVLMYARMAGLLLLGHAIFIICLPRLILGFHWSSDIIAGAAIGVTLAVLLQRRLVTWLGLADRDWRNSASAIRRSFMLFSLPSCVKQPQCIVAAAIS